MKTRHEWKPANRLDSIMNVLLIVLALSVLGLGALEMHIGTTQVATTETQQT